MLDYLVQCEIPFIIVLTKADKLNKTERQKRLDSLKEELADFDGIQCIPFSAINGEGVENLRAILDEVASAQ